MSVHYGVASSDITGGSAIVWSRTDRPARMIVEYDTTESFGNPKRLISQVPLLVQWDDHEVRNNWYPSQAIANDDRYTEKNIDVLARRAKQAFLEYQPIRYNPRDPKRIYRSFKYGPSLDIFMLDERSYRGPNSTIPLVHR